METENRPRGESMRRILNQLMLIQLTAVALILLAFTGYTIAETRQNAARVMDNFCQVYASQLEARLVDINTDMVQILNEDQNLNRLSSRDDNERLYAQLDLQKMLRDMMAYSTGADCYAIYEGGSGTYLDYWAYNWHKEGKDEVQRYVRSLYEAEQDVKGWHFEVLSGKTFGVKLYRWRSRIIVALIDINTLLDIVPDTVDMGYCVVLSDPEGGIRKFGGEALFDREVMESGEKLPEKGLISTSLLLSYDQVRLTVYQQSIRLMSQLRQTSVLIALAMLILLVIDLIFTRRINRYLIRPMERMTRDMQSIREGEHEVRIQDEKDVEEFRILAGTFNRLMDEIFQLKINYYEKQLDLAEAEQKYINLQIKPHFFLNALTSIAALSKMGQNESVENYIAALNKNIRYMFGSGMHTVACREEMEHVENYFEMQEMKYPGMVFYYVDMPEETEEWRIPQMIVHTIVENEYKYAVAEGSLLSVYIRTCIVERDGERMLLLEIEDDGPGYPESVLEYMAGRGERDSSDGRRVGLWSLKRLLETMYDREGLMEVENAEFHGAVSRFYIPEKPVNERGRVR